MKTFLLILSLCCSLYTGKAVTIDMVAYGGVPDGQTDNTEIIQQAIDACSEQTGSIVFPAGKYLTGALFLRSNVHIRLEAGAEILGSTDLEAYLKAFPNRKGKESPALFFARDAENISITGHGVINGQGEHPNFQLGNDSKRGPIRPKIIYLIGCRNVRITDITLHNPAYWTQDYEDCDGVFIRGVKVFAHANYNNDGLDIDSRNVVVSDCIIDCDDDALCFKSDTRDVTENITVTNCVLKSNCNAIKFGTSSYSGFRNISVSNCVLSAATEDRIRQWYRTEPWLGVSGKTVISGIALESVDGGVMEDIVISAITMRDVQTPIFIRLGDRRRTLTQHISQIKNIVIDNIVALSDGKMACSITGVPGGAVENVSVSNVRMTVSGGGTAENVREEVPEKIAAYPENRMFGVVLPASGFYVRHAKDIRFNNVCMETLSPDERPMFYLDDAAGIEILSCKNNHRAADVKNNHPDGNPNLSHTSAEHSHTSADHPHTSTKHSHTSAKHSHTSADHPHTSAKHSYTSADHSHTSAKQMKSNFTN
jgi:polygalacturonase